MLKKFLRDEKGQFAVITALCALPLFGAVAMSIDFSNLSRLRHDLKDSLDAANSNLAKAYVEGGKTNAELYGIGRSFFDANFDEHYLSKVDLTITLPDDPLNTTRELKMKAKLKYDTMFGPVLAGLTHASVDNYSYVVEISTMRMRNVAEIALVLDNSGSMVYDKFGNTSGVAVANQRITLLKKASKDLVTSMIDLGAKIQQVSNPVKFSLVPFSASVNVGASNASAGWMDTRGVSPIHHEHLDWGTASPTNPAGFRSVGPDGAKLDASNNPLTRFSIYNSLKFRSGGTESATQCEVWKQGTTGSSTSNCAVFKRTGTLTDVGASSAAAATAIADATYNQAALAKKYAWGGCVEMRPNGLDVTDETPGPGNPSSLFVPMFAPDDFNASQYGTTNSTSQVYAGVNNWWPDFETDASFIADTYWSTYNDSGQALYSAAAPTSSTWWTSTSRPRMANAAKYIKNKPYLSGQNAPSSTSGRIGQWQYFRGEAGPNNSCTTEAITPLTGNKAALHAAIDKMAATGNTNVPEGLAWGWRTVSSKAPFSEGVVETNKAIDKVVIVLTDGANTYGDLSAGNNGDVTGTQSTYAAFGYSGYAGNGGTNGTAALSSATNIARIFKDTTASKTTHDQTNFQKAMDEKMLKICDNVKGQDIILMTVALDLDPANYSSAAQKAEVNKALATLTSCAGESKTRKKSDGTPEKLFWNAKSDTLDTTFKEISDELSNLRFTN